MRHPDAPALVIPAETGQVAAESLGGYRLVRKLGEGPRAEVFLAHPQSNAPDAVPVAIKLTLPHVASESVLAEAGALSRAAGPHIVELLDAAPGSDGSIVLILQRLPGGSVSRLLHDRRILSRGEAITILAPIALAVSRLHDAGVAHGGIRAEAVLFDATGAPVLACFGRSTLVEPALPPARREAEPALAGDLRALATLAVQVLAVTADGRELADWIESSVELHVDDWLDQLVGRLFALGDPQPVAFREDSPAPAVPSRLVSGAPVLVPEAVSPMLPPWLDGLLPPVLAKSAPRMLLRLRTSLSTVRRPVWFAAGGVAVALLAAVAFVPQSESDAQPAPLATPSATPTPLANVGPVTADDPVAALLALLETRERCIRDLSVLCLDDVAQSGSAALAADQQLIRGLQDGSEAADALPLDELEITLVDRLGDSAILDLASPGESEPASVLLMKGEAGWRIRGYLE